MTHHNQYIIFYILFAILNCNNSFCSNNDSNSTINQTVKYLIDRPISASFEQTSFTNEATGISRVNLGFDSEYYNAKQVGHEGFISRDFTRAQFCNISPGYKYYAGNKKNNFAFVDFNLFQWKSFIPSPFGFTYGAYVNIFSKKTKWFSNNYTDWANGGIIFGLMYPFSRYDIVIGAYLQGGLGFMVFKPDTLTCPNLINDFRATNYRISESLVTFAVIYKSFNFEYSGYLSGSTGSNSFTTENESFKLSYTLWKDRTYTDSDDFDSSFLNTFKVYLSYNIEKLSIGKVDKKDSANATYNINNKMINLGVSFSLGKLNIY